MFEKVESLNTVLKEIEILEKALIELNDTEAEPLTILCHYEQLVKLHKSCMFCLYEEKGDQRVEIDFHCAVISKYAKNAIKILDDLLLANINQPDHYEIAFYWPEFGKMFLKIMTLEEVKQWLVEMHFSYLGAFREMIRNTYDLEERQSYNERIVEHVAITPLNDMIKYAFSNNLQRKRELLEYLELMQLGMKTPQDNSSRKRKLDDISDEKSSEQTAETRSTFSQSTQTFFLPAVTETNVDIYLDFLSKGY